MAHPSIDTGEPVGLDAVIDGLAGVVGGEPRPRSASRTESEHSITSLAVAGDTEAIAMLKWRAQEEAEREAAEAAAAEEEEEEEEIPSVEDARRDLCEAIDGVHGTGSFATFGAIPYLPDPYLAVDAGPPIMLPLGHPDALRIMTASHLAPFGRGLETLVDQSDYMNTAIRDCCKGLGLENVNIQAQLYKLLLYEPGAMFKPHTDTEKVPGMFGTMIISLPSRHHGGTLELSHNGLAKQFSTSEQIGASMAAWYSDVRHEVKPVTFGYRLVLTFNLVQDVAQGYGVGFAMRFPTLEEAIRMWSRACAEEGDDTPALYALEHQYTDASISLQTLKANDLAKAQALQQFAIQHNFVLYLASCEKEVSGDAEEGDDDYDGYSRSKRRRYGYDDYGETSDEYHQITYESASSLRIQRLVDVTGTELAQDLEITEEDFLQDAPYDDRDPTECEHTGPTGNAGASATHWYRDTVLVMVQTRQVVKFLLRGYGDDCRGAIMADKRVQHFVANRQDHQAADDVRTV
ncbi:hypothetical protein LTR17_015775 [Elasticomyces elasticus]|nr:hypothetical protein LTR17_015775 [Elasticomyces elasticus]